MGPMTIYDQLRNTPKEAQKSIEAGRLKGFTDINPMWRFRRLTEVFGPCGSGWKIVITDKQIVPGANGEITAFVFLDLYYRIGDSWSDPVPGIGGSMFVAQERSGLHTNDEAFKMALSDAIGTACKALGMSEDIYFSKYRSKYNATPQPDAAPAKDFKMAQFSEGDYLGETLQDVWRKDLCYVSKYLKTGTDEDMKAAIRAMSAWVKSNAG